MHVRIANNLVLAFISVNLMIVRWDIYIMQMTINFCFMQNYFGK